MEGLSGGGGTISAEFLQNIQTAVDSSGVVGKVQVIETDEGPMTVIFMEEGSDASALTNSQIFTDAGLTVGDDANIQYTVADTGDVSHTQIQYVDDVGNPVDPLQYGIDSGDGTQVQYQFISAEDYTGLLGNGAAGTVGGETNQTSQDGNAVAVDPVFTLDQYVTSQQMADELSAQQHVSGQQSENLQVPGSQNTYEHVLNDVDAYQQIQGHQASNPQVHRQQATNLQISNEQATGPPVSDNETLLQATGVGGETLYITESGEIIKIDTSLLADSQYSMNGGGAFCATSVGNLAADEQFVATKILADQLGNENAQSYASSSVHFSTVPSVSMPRFVIKPGVRTNKKQSYKRREVGNSQPAVGRSVLPTKTATSFNLNIDNTQSISKNKSFLSPYAAKQQQQVLTFKSNDNTYIITSVDSQNATSMGVGMQTKPKNSLATIKPQLTSQTSAMRKNLLLAEKPAVTLQSATSQRKLNTSELDKGTMTSILPKSKVQTMTTIMKSPGTSSSQINTDRIEYMVSKSSVASASSKNPLLTIANEALSSSAITVKGIITSKPTTFMPQVSKLRIAGIQANKTDVNKYGSQYKMPLNIVTNVTQQTPTVSDGTREVEKPDNQSQTGLAHPGSIEAENLTDVIKETTQTLTGDGNVNHGAVVNGDESISFSNNQNNSTVVNNTLVDDNIVTATDVLSNTQASSAVSPIDEQKLENSENNKDGGIDDASELQSEDNLSESIKTITDSSEVNNIVPLKLCSSLMVTNTTEYEDSVPNGLEKYTPIFHSYQCSICSEEFKTEANFKKHHLHRHTEKLTCLACNQNFRSGHILNNHMTLMHTMGKPLTCPDCNVGFLKSSLYWAHATRHACLFECNSCQKFFNSNVDLQRHLVDGHIEKNLKCVQCGQVFRSREEVHEHKRLQHNMAEQKSHPNVAEQSTEISGQEFSEEALSPTDSTDGQSEVALYIDSHGQLTQQQIVHPAKTVNKPPVNVQVTVQKEEIEQGKTLQQHSSKANESEITNSSHSDINQSSAVVDKQSSDVSKNKPLVISSPQFKSIEVPGSDVTVQLYADGTLVTSDKSGTNYSKVRLEDVGLDHAMHDGNTNIELLIVQGDGKEVRAIINTGMQSDIHKTDLAKKSPEFNKELQDEKKSHVQPPLEDEDGIVSVTTDDPRPYKCSMCPRTFKFYRTFKCHEIVHSKAETYICHLCQRLFARESNLKSHLQLHEKKAAMQRHTSTNGSNQSQIRDGKLWHCEHCAMSFTACTNMLRHIRQQHENITGVACPICDKRFLNEANVQRHTKTHVGPFPCSYCDSKFDVHDELADHLKELHREKLFSCKFCEKIWLSKKSLILHVSEHHGSTLEGKELLEDLKKYECEECGCKFAKKFALTRHMLVHTKEGDCQCTECPKRFDCQWKLTKHQKTHETPTIHECFECNEKFKFPHLLERHKISYHQGPYLCSECKEEFSSRLNLEDHQYEKHECGFTCAKCTKKLKNSLELDRHVNADHSTVGTSSFLCENCEESFEHKAQLKTHLLKKHYNASKAAMFKEYPEMRTVHDELTCEICDAYCKNKTVYKQHFKDEHFDGDADAMYEVCPELKTFPDPPDPVVCDHCGKSCTNLMYLNMHLKIHGIAANNKENKDRDDSGSSDDEDNDENEEDFTNIESQDTDKPYKCKECGENFAHQAALKKHAKSHEKDYFKEASKNMVHNDLQGRQKSVKKAFGKSFDSSALAKSPKRKSSVMHIVCDTCQQVFKSKAEFKVHRKAQVCGKESDKIVNEEILSVSKILIHANIHKCKCCGKTFASTYNLKRHLKQIHNTTINSDDLLTQESDKNFGEMMPQYSALKKARIVASSQKTFKASSKTADDGTLLEDGTDISTFLGMNFNLGKTPSSPCNIESVKKKCHKCTICGKGFSREATLKKHLLLHKEGNGSELDMKPDRKLTFMADWKKALYPCQNCGNMYSTAGGLIYHSRLRHPDIDEDTVVTKINEITDKLKADKMGKINNEAKDPEIRMAQKRKLSEPNEKTDELDKKKIKIDETVKSTFPCQHCDTVYKSSNCLSLHLNACHADKSEITSESNDSSAKQKCVAGRVIAKNSKYEQQVRCSQCSKNFDDMSNFRHHVTAFHKDKQNFVAQKLEPEDHQQKCEHCNKKFLALPNLRRHLKMKHNICLDDSVTYSQEETKGTAVLSAVYDCDVCEQKFSSLFTLRNHMLTVHDEKDEFDIVTKEELFECPVCHREFASKNHLDTHMQKHTGEKPYECNVCSKKHICKSKLELHLKKLHREQWLRKIKCKICLFLFDTEDAMMKHKVVHRKEVLEETTSISTPITYKCLKCDKLFRWKRNLVSHARIFHRDLDPLTCGICNKVFPDKESITDHLKEHHEQKRTCEICMKSFSRKSELKQHEAIAHKGTVNLSCDICKQSFVTKQKLLEHMLSHTSIMPHKCDICSVSFKAVHLLKAHNLRHTLKKEKHQDLNLKSVTSANNSRVKSNTICKKCNRKFSTKWSLKVHMAKAHKGGQTSNSSLKTKKKVRTTIEALKDKVSPKTEFKEKTLSKVETKQKATKFETSHFYTTKITEQKSKSVLRKTIPLSKLKSPDVKQKTKQYSKVVKTRVPPKKTLLRTKRNTPLTKMKSPALKIKTVFQKKALTKKAVLIARKNIPASKQKTTVQEIVKGIKHCDACNLDFASYKLFKKHFKHTHGIFKGISKKEKVAVDLMCPICQTVFSTRQNLKRHLKIIHTVHSVKPLSSSTKKVVQFIHCSECNRIFWYKDQFELHTKKAHPDKAALQLDLKSSGVLKKEVDGAKLSSPKQGQPSIEKFRRKCEFCFRIHWSKKTFEDHLLNFHPEHAETYGLKEELSEEMPEIEIVNDGEEINKYLHVYLFENTSVEKLSAYPVVIIERMSCGFGLIPIEDDSVKLQNKESRNVHKSIVNDIENALEMTVNCIPDGYKFDGTVAGNSAEQLSDQNEKNENVAEALVIENVRSIENVDKISESEDTDMLSRSFENEDAGKN